MKRTNGQGGITLIALVVTIVVLLILAGITITYVLADDGLFGKAQEAGEAQEMATIRDYAGLATANAVATWYTTADRTSLDAAAALTLVDNNFPAGYTVAAGTPPVDFVDNGNGALEGKVTVTVNEVVYTVDFSKSPFEVTPPAAPSGT